MLKLEGKEYPFEVNMNVVFQTLEDIGEEEIAYIDTMFREMQKNPTRTHFKTMVRLIANGINEGIRLAVKEGKEAVEFNISDEDLLLALTGKDSSLADAMGAIASNLPQAEAGEGK